MSIKDFWIILLVSTINCNVILGQGIEFSTEDNAEINISPIDSIGGNSFIVMERNGEDGQAAIIYNFVWASDSVKGKDPRWSAGIQGDNKFDIAVEHKVASGGDLYYHNAPFSIDFDNKERERVSGPLIEMQYGNLQLGSQTLESIETPELKALKIHRGDLIPEDYVASYDLGNAEIHEHWDNVVAREFVEFSILTFGNSKSLKSNGYGLDQIMQLSPVKSTNLKSKESKIALDPYDVINYIPEAVHTYDYDGEEDGKRIKKKVANYGMKYNQLIPVLIQAIQDQQEIINELQADVAQLKEQQDR